MEHLTAFGILILVGFSAVEGYDIIVPDMRTYQSSTRRIRAGSLPTSQDTLLGANRAIDRNVEDEYRAGHHSKSGCSSTNEESNPWWAIDLHRPYSIDYIKLTTRYPFEYNLEGFIIGVTDVHPRVVTPVPGGYPECARYSGVIPKQTVLNVNCTKGANRGRYVIIQVPRTSMVEICEFQLVAESDNILSPHLHTYQSASNLAPGMPILPHLAIDGVYRMTYEYSPYGPQRNCSQIAPMDWWAVDLDRTHFITSVKLFFGKGNGEIDPKDSVRVGVTYTSPLDQIPTTNTQTLCALMLDQTECEFITLTCPSAGGQYIIIQNSGKQVVQICEVEAFGSVG